MKGLLTDLDHATGPEKEELLAELEGRKQFGDAYLTGPMGTLEKPVIVKSFFDTRYVGCVGTTPPGLCFCILSSLYLPRLSKDGPRCSAKWLKLSANSGDAGGEGDAGHDLIWHELTNKKDLVCAECGQAFRLEKMEE